MPHLKIYKEDQFENYISLVAWKELILQFWNKIQIQTQTFIQYWPVTVTTLFKDQHWLPILLKFKNLSYIIYIKQINKLFSLYSGMYAESQNSLISRDTCCTSSPQKQWCHTTGQHGKWSDVRQTAPWEWNPHQQRNSTFCSVHVEAIFGEPTHKQLGVDKPSVWRCDWATLFHVGGVSNLR